MPDIQVVKALADAGGWAACIFLVTLIGIGATKRFRFWVPGWIYEDERHQREVAETQTERTIKTLEKQTTAISLMGRDVAKLRADVEQLRAQLAAATKPVNRD